eukprot:CAMPEP_0168529980 /NCGR_PEP_ID=MMETSP0405-20121227/14312_1 /TAXON_ID=498012 /ORGANISM="Trichosphaerium sp, Strain Am-I-7 wt" /LENGTH=65 /DNA_ID=CAMNT_0008553969 /DNA_START=102 /DNA_END=299 /DNA_ORIENTATION=-
MNAFEGCIDDTFATKGRLSGDDVKCIQNALAKSDAAGEILGPIWMAKQMAMQERAQAAMKAQGYM